MRCSECDSENFEGSKFCVSCGSHLELVCVHCGTKLPHEAKFCNECGRAVSSTKQDSVLDTLDRDYIGALKRGEPINLADLVKHFETHLIESALLATEGKIMRAADLLGIKRTTLSAKLHGHRRER